jgi:DNA gyrase inhibitor GyrI
VAGGDVAAGGDQQAQLQEEWTAFVKWFRSNGGIISSKLTVKVNSPHHTAAWRPARENACVVPMAQRGAEGL